MKEIARVARLHRCQSVLLGLSEISESTQDRPQEELLGRLDADVVVLRARPGWRLSKAIRILVPVAGRGVHEHLRARFLGSLVRTSEREVTFVQVLPRSRKPSEVRRAQRDLRRLGDDEVGEHYRYQVEVLQSDDAVAAIAERAAQCDLVILGVQRLGRRRKLLGEFTRQVAARTSCPVVVMSRRG
jgi:nucleotide-binding universal stress UspA family protein